MIGELFNNPIAFILYFAALIIAIAIHEFAHAFAADRLGDPTPRLQGRLTLNPLAHLDPMGTILMLFFRFGWGKPVEFDPFNLRHPRRDAAIISLAGPVSNILLAAFCAVLLRFVLISAAETVPFIVFVATFVYQLIVVNVVLAVFNLLPIHPLDGFKVVGGILPEEHSRQWYELAPYGLFFLLFLLLPIFGSSPIQKIIGPPINFLLQILLPGQPVV